MLGGKWLARSPASFWWGCRPNQGTSQRGPYRRVYCVVTELLQQRPRWGLASRCGGWAALALVALLAWASLSLARGPQPGQLGRLVREIVIDGE